MDIWQRIIASSVVALLVGLGSGPFILSFLRKLKVGQVVREDGPSSHLKKSGTPTMGGLLFVFPLLLITLIFVPAGALATAIPWLWVTLGLGVVGFLDDYIIIVRRQSLGLKARHKLIGQMLVALILYAMLRSMGHSQIVGIPLLNIYLDLDWLYLPFVTFLVMAAGNGANLTDGVDGLLASVTIVAALAYVFIGWISGVEAVAILCAALVGVLIAFLRFNWHPARVFMGDVGSMALGGALAGAAILTKTEILLLPIGIVYVLTTLSLIIQVVYFRKTGGKRFFRMSPIHHHFELVGWSEIKIVCVWSLVAAAGGIIGILALVNMSAARGG